MKLREKQMKGGAGEEEQQEEEEEDLIGKAEQDFFAVLDKEKAVFEEKEQRMKQEVEQSETGSFGDNDSAQEKRGDTPEEDKE